MKRMLLLLLLKEKGQGMLVVGQVVQAVLVATPILHQVVKDFFGCWNKLILLYVVVKTILLQCSCKSAIEGLIGRLYSCLLIEADIVLADSDSDSSSANGSDAGHSSRT